MSTEEREWDVAEFPDGRKGNSETETKKILKSKINFS
jgi:hypothetical protein